MEWRPSKKALFLCFFFFCVFLPFPPSLALFFTFFFYCYLRWKRHCKLYIAKLFFFTHKMVKRERGGTFGWTCVSVHVRATYAQVLFTTWIDCGKEMHRVPSPGFQPPLFSVFSPDKKSNRIKTGESAEKQKHTCDLCFLFYEVFVAHFFFCFLLHMSLLPLPDLSYTRDSVIRVWSPGVTQKTKTATTVNASASHGVQALFHFNCSSPCSLPPLLCTPVILFSAGGGLVERGRELLTWQLHQRSGTRARIQWHL